LLFVLALLHRSRYTRGNDIYWVFAAYFVAKIFETFTIRYWRSATW